MASEPELHELSLSQLVLDPKNPRLPKAVRGKESSIIDYIARESAIDDLVESIARNGYFSSEPIIVYPTTPSSKHTSSSTYYVAEGNRRITALKLLHEPSLYPRRKKIAAISAKAKHKPTAIPAIIYKDRTATLALLGYRHITGIKQWDPLAKARYIEELLEEFGTGTDTDADYNTVAEMVGSRIHYVRRFLDTLTAYDLIEQNDFFGIDGLDESTIEFSVLLTAVGYGAIHAFLSAYDETEDKLDFHSTIDPIELKNLELLTRWLFEKDSDGNTRIEESRNIRKLNEIVEHPQALMRFTGGAKIDIAYRLTSGAEQDFAQYINDAESSLAGAASLVANVDLKSTYVPQAKDILKQATQLLRNLSDEN